MLILKFKWKGKGTIILKKILKKSKVGGIILANFKRYKSTVIKTVRYLLVKEQTDQWSKIKSRNSLTQIWTFDFWKVYKGNSMEKAQSSQQIALEQLDIHMQ